MIDLSLIVWAPLVLTVLAGLAGRRAGWAAALLSLVPLGLSISVLAAYGTGGGGLRDVTDTVWISALGIHYKLGVDGLNVALVLLTNVLFSAALLWSAFREWERPRLYVALFGMAQSAVLGAFVAQDLALFVGFFDLMLVPFYFLAGIWGGSAGLVAPGAEPLDAHALEAAREARVRGITKLVIYTLVGSFLMLAAAVATGVIASSEHSTPLTFVISSLQKLPLSHRSQEWIFLCFAVAFLVKMPMIPFHGWLADGYKSMPIPAVAVFSGVLSKVAAYGFLRIVLPLFPFATAHFQTAMLVLALISILWGTAMAFTTLDARLVLAYSSVAQLAFITLGIFSLRVQGEQGALLQMLNHALVTVPMFFIVGALAVRTGGSEDIREMGGIAFRAPMLAALFLISALATLAMPGSSNFVGEFFILLGVFQAKMAISIIAFLGVAGAAVYALRLFIRAMHNRVGPRVDSFEGRRGDLLPIAALVALIIALAFVPQFGLRRSERSVRATLTPVAQAANDMRMLATASVPGTHRVYTYSSNGSVTTP